MRTLTFLWNKWTSLKFLESRGLNVPFCILIQDTKGLLNLFKVGDGKRISIRTFRPDKDIMFDFKTPFYPNYSVGSDLMEVLLKHLNDGYSIIASEPIDPKLTLYKGNLAIDREGSLWLDYSGGPGTIREMDERKSPKISSRIVSVESMFQIEKVMADIGGSDILEDFFLLLNIGEPVNKFILEWSLYSKPVGVKQKSHIYWEIRPFGR